MRTEAEDRVRNATIAMQKAFREFNAVWADHESGPILDAACERHPYPFHRSFDELALVVDDFCHDLIKDLSYMAEKPEVES